MTCHTGSEPELILVFSKCFMTLGRGVTLLIAAFQMCLLDTHNCIISVKNLIQVFKFFLNYLFLHYVLHTSHLL